MSTPNSEVAILARLLINGGKRLPPDVACYVLSLTFSDNDRARMHALAVRNQDGSSSATEREDMFAYAKLGTLRSILKSRARRVLRLRPKKPTLPL
jgi:hypothetical protein